MKVSYSWIKEYLNVDLNAVDCAKVLTDTGLEVEGIQEIESIKGGLKGLVIGNVLTCEQHPNADRLRKTTVTIGNETLEIVCGAPNIAAGQNVVVATVGTILYDDKGESFKIKKGKIRGEVSLGMICGSDEIGMGGAHDGIMVLDENAKPGTPASEYFKLESDTVFEIGLTPNRSDAMGHMGVALDLRAGLAAQGVSLDLCKPSVEAFAVDNTDLSIDVTVEDNELCPRYAGLTISGLKVKESPEWLRRRLEALGLAPINNIVDITNYVLHETGNPLHAFDASKIKGNKIVVKTLDKDTKFTTLDDHERKLDASDLMICNNQEPMCIAGVFGGADSGVSETTSSIFLEAAFFNPVSVRKTAKRHALNTDASFRFERTVNPNTVIWALKRAALLMKEIAGGVISSEITDIYPTPIENFVVDFSYDKCDRLIGEVINRDTIKSILANLEMEILEENTESLKLSVPPYRADVQREVDVIEEVLRIYGYNNIGMTGRINASLSIAPKPDAHKIQERVSDLLSSNGFHEGMCNSLTKASYTDGIDALKKDSQVILLNPLSQDLNAMRQTLMFGGLEGLAYNINRKVSDVFLYEFGKTYNRYGDEFVEERRLALWMTGKKQEESWNAKSDKVDFFHMKGIVEKILQKLGLNQGVSLSQTQTDLLSEAVVYKIRKKKVVELGIVRKSILKNFSIKQEVFYADLNWDAILEMLKDQKTSYKEVSKFPAVRRDLALLLDEKVAFTELEAIALRSDKSLLKEVKLFDVYQGDTLPEGKKSYALSFVFRDEEKTLTDKVVDKAILKIFKSLEHQLKAELRDGTL
jgi:phenylalanyl-tRNA synthetase beta chain